MWQRMAAFITVMAILLWGVLLLLLDYLQAGTLARVTDKASDYVVIRQLLMAAEVAKVRNDLIYLATLPEVAEVLDGGEGHGALARHFSSFVANNDLYSKIRLLDEQGKELVRIERTAGQIVEASAAQLEEKGTRYYFSEAMARQPGEFYVSPLDLSVERDKIELPLKPVLRFAVPVADLKGRKRGVIIINYLGTRLLSHMSPTDNSLPGRAALLNSDGSYIAGFQAEQSWSFMFPGHEQEQFSVTHAAIWSQLAAHPQGQMPDGEGGYYSYGTVDLVVSPPKACRNCKLVLLHHLRAADLEQLYAIERDSMLPTLTAGYLLVLLLAGLLFYSIEQRRRSTVELAALATRVRQERDLFNVGPAVIFLWRNEFGWPVDYVSDNVKTMFGYPTQEFTARGLGLAGIVEPADLPRITQELTEWLASAKETFERSPFRLVDRKGRLRWVRETLRVVRDDKGRATAFYSYITDIGQLKAAEAEIEQSRTFVQKVLDTIADPTLVVDVGNFHVISANEAARRTYLNNKTMATALTCYQWSHKTDKPCNSEDEPCPIQAIVRTGQPNSVVHRHYDAKGNPFYVEVSAMPILDENGEVVQIVESHRDITQHVETRRELKQLATTDHLTGAFNRRQFEAVLERQMLQTARGGGQLGLIMFDIDHFKHINDRHGHDVGDQVLKTLVKIVKEHVRENDLLARWGGEEFMVLLPRVDLQGVEAVAETIRRTVEETPFPVAGHVSISLGVTVWCPGDDPERMVNRVDQALYTSKASGRNRCTISISEGCGKGSA